MQVGTQQDSMPSGKALEYRQFLHFSLQRDGFHQLCHAVDVAVQSVLGMRQHYTSYKIHARAYNSAIQMLFALDLGYPSSDLLTGGPKQDLIKQRIQEDFVKADIYFQTLNVQTIKQEKKYSVRKASFKYEIAISSVFFLYLRLTGFLPDSEVLSVFSWAWLS